MKQIQIKRYGTKKTKVNQIIQVVKFDCVTKNYFRSYESIISLHF